MKITKSKRSSVMSSDVSTDSMVDTIDNVMETEYDPINEAISSIKYAIDCLSEAAIQDDNKDKVTESIANLSVVMLDLQS